MKKIYSLSFLMAIFCSLSFNTKAQTYCTADGACDEAINAFSLNGVSNTSSCTGGYADNTSTTISLMQGVSYPVSITTTLYYTGDQAYVWVDYNKDFAFDTTEITILTYTGSGGVFTGNVNVPSGASLGTTRLRARMLYTTYYGPCGTANYGETEDYTVNIVAATACSGTPNAGTTTSSVSYVCASQNFNLSNSGSTLASGITYQWQSSADNVNWTNIGGATNTSYSGTQSSDTYYRLAVSCGSNTGYSNSVLITMGLYYNCYCNTGLGGSCAGNAIDSISITGTTLANFATGCADNAGPNYSVYPASGNTTATLTAGTTYDLVTVTQGDNVTSIWIDYDHSGTFDPNEWKQISTTSTANQAITTQLTIPANALGGPTGMRLRTRITGFTNDSTSACLSMGSGEIEDYIIDIANPTLVNSVKTIKEVMVYPNPAKDMVNIVFENKTSSSISVRLMAINGQEIWNDNLNNFSGTYQKTIDMKGLSNGIYTLQIVTDKETIVKKVVLNN